MGVGHGRFLLCLCPVLRFGGVSGVALGLGVGLAGAPFGSAGFARVSVHSLRLPGGCSSARPSRIRARLVGVGASGRGLCLLGLRSPGGFRSGLCGQGALAPWGLGLRRSFRPSGGLAAGGLVRWRHRLWVAPSGVIRPWALPFLALRRRFWRFRFGWFIPRSVALRVRARAWWQSRPAGLRAFVRWFLGWAVPVVVGLSLLRGLVWLVAVFSRRGS